jgi:hypothetical protein
MISKFTGIVKQITEPQTGRSQSGNDWTKRDLVLYNADARYKENTLAFTFWNDKVKDLEKLSLKEGDIVDVEFFLSSEEFNEKWMTKTSGRSVKKLKRRQEDRTFDVVNSLKTITHLADAIYVVDVAEKQHCKAILESIETIINNIDLPEFDTVTIKKAIAEYAEKFEKAA